MMEIKRKNRTNEIRKRKKRKRKRQRKRKKLRKKIKIENKIILITKKQKIIFKE